MNYSFFVGIDISKLWFDVALLGVNAPRTTKQKQFENTPEGFVQLSQWLLSQGVSTLCEVFFCLEHTGVYSVPLSRFLNEQKLAYTLVAGNEIKQSSGITRGKNDQIDARRIAQYAYKNRDFIRIHTLPVDAIRKLKAMLAYRERLLKAKHGFQVAQKELNAFETDQVVDSITTQSQQMIQQIHQQVLDLDKALRAFLKSQPELKASYDLLLSVPGIGEQNAMYLIVVTQNFVCFDCPKKFAAYAGVAPYDSTSGSSLRSTSKVSHQANKKIKALMSSAVVCSLRTCAEYKDYYNKQIQRGKNPYSVKNALRNKIIKRAFAVIKKQTPYVDTHAYAA
jgi:transposase